MARKDGLFCVGMPARAYRILLSIGFLCSGAIALVYEVIWQRQFALLFGSGAPATAIVLAAYFAGLGLGSFVLGRWGRSWGKALTMYAALEVVVALGALIVTPILAMYAAWYPAIMSNFAHGGTGLLVLKGALAFGAILIPTAAMGGTLPVLAEVVDSGRDHLGVNVGWLYAVNTAGAALGAAAFPFLCLPLLGSHGSVLVCAAGNVVIAGVAFWMRRKWPETSAPPRRPGKAMERLRGRQGVLLLLAFISGAGIFALQVLWYRAFAQVHENSIYSFALIVTVFILAIALGAQVARWFLRKGVVVERGLGFAWFIGGVAVGFCPALFVRMTDGLGYLGGTAGWGTLMWRGAAVILLPTALLSVALPLLLERAGKILERPSGEITGRVLTVNIAGSIAGALLAGFLLPSWVGMWNAMIATGLTLSVIGACILWKAPAARVAAMLGLAGLGWLQQSGDLPRVRVDVKRGERLLAVEEGAYGIAAVTERAGSRRLKLNNHYTLGGTFATGDERLQAHLPLLLHPQPKRAVFLGFGTGITAGGALFHSNVNVQAVELAPEVTRLAATHFAEANGNFHTRSNTQLIIDDARNFLRGTREKFDVIVSDIVVPWQQGEAALYTVEHFAAAKRALNTNGIFCAWAPAFQLGEAEFQILVRTFLTVFGSAQVWRGDFSPTRPALALVASERPLEAEALSRRVSEIADPANPHLSHARGLWLYFVGIVRSENFEEKRINSEGQPWLELLAPLHEGTSGFFVGAKLAAWEAQFAVETEQLMAQLSADAAAGYRGGRLMVEWTQATFEGDQRRAEEVQVRMRAALGEDVYRLIFGLP